MWGIDAVNKIIDEIESKLDSIGDNSVTTKVFGSRHPELFVTSIRYHKIFYLHDNGGIPEIIGIIHKRRNIVLHLQNRLG